ncbi:MAG: hypothetical protein Q9183_007276, partial [Haloplaca sp. 2 TL-2023]
NVRYAAPPTGDLRWAKPAAPTPESGIQDGSYGPICIPAPTGGPQLEGEGANSSSGGALDQLLPGIPVPSLKEASEDCLFLDLYVPAKAIENPSLRLPVISWFHGGAFTFGGKDQFEPVLPLYDGTGLLQESGGNVIFVASNYRVSRFYQTISLFAFNSTPSFSSALRILEERFFDMERDSRYAGVTLPIFAALLPQYRS